MEYTLKVIKILYLALCSLTLCCCGSEKDSDVVIGRKTMSRIISDMYLADQYINRNPVMEAQADTMFVYRAILEKYGYTVNDYRFSIKYYLQDHDTYSQILRSSRTILDNRHNQLEKLLDKERKMTNFKLDRWWGLDSVRRTHHAELKYDPLLRGIRWMVLPKENIQPWKMSDSAIVDIPQNPLWWKITANTPKREYNTFMVIDKEETGSIR